MVRALFNEDLRMSLNIEATQGGLHHATIQNFLKIELKLYAYNLQMHLEVNDLHKLKRILLVGYSRSKRRNNPEFFKWVVLCDECETLLLKLVSKQICQVWVWEGPNEVYRLLKNGLPVVVLGTKSKKEVIAHCPFENNDVTWNTN